MNGAGEIQKVYFAITIRCPWCKKPVTVCIHRDQPPIGGEMVSLRCPWDAARLTVPAQHFKQVERCQCANPLSPNLPPHDISKPNTHLGMQGQIRNWPYFLLCCAGLLALLGLYFGSYWICLAAPVLPLIIPAAWIAWHFAVRLGTFTWMRLARAPAKSMARGNAAQAERAFAKALERARRFSSQDYRRGLMLNELALYAKKQGRFSAAKALLEECIEIPIQNWNFARVSYFAVLKNYAVYYMDVRDYAAAQRIWEHVLDVIPVLKKDNLDGQWVEWWLHLDLGALFIEMDELAESTCHFQIAEQLFQGLTKSQQANNVDYYCTIRALCMCALGKYENASAELKMVKNLDLPRCIWVRAKVHLGRHEFLQAEQLVRKFCDLERKNGSVHRPELVPRYLDLSESLFGQGKHDEAFLALQEGRAIVADFQLRPNPAWRKALAAWLQRAKELGRLDEIEALEADLQSIATKSDQAITISSRLRAKRDHNITVPAADK
jgi:tetratricopeptide (TPR) repeat protein